jgi:hypothetical protein
MGFYDMLQNKGRGCMKESPRRYGVGARIARPSLSDMDEAQTRKSYDFLLDQKQLQELMRAKEV